MRLSMNSVKQFLIAVDQLLNTMLWFLPGGTWADETLSARAWRCRDSAPFTKMRPVIDRLFFWQSDHCKASYEAEIRRSQLPKEERACP
jgi:hypothetical protein